MSDFESRTRWNHHLRQDFEGSSEYRLVATTRTSTPEKELRDDGQAGFGVVGMTVGKTALGGRELVAIVRRPKS